MKINIITETYDFAPRVMVTKSTLETTFDLEYEDLKAEIEIETRQQLPAEGDEILAHVRVTLPHTCDKHLDPRLRFGNRVCIFGCPLSSHSIPHFGDQLGAFKTHEKARYEALEYVDKELTKLKVALAMRLGALEKAGR
jgi:hypothetical protein